MVGVSLDKFRAADGRQQPAKSFVRSGKRKGQGLLSLVLRLPVGDELHRVVHAPQGEVYLPFGVRDFNPLHLLLVLSEHPGQVLGDGGDDFPLVGVRLADAGFLLALLEFVRALAHILGDLRLLGGQVVLGFLALLDLLVVPLAVSLLSQGIIVDALVRMLPLVAVKILVDVLFLCHAESAPFYALIIAHGGVFVNNFFRIPHRGSIKREPYTWQPCRNHPWRPCEPLQGFSAVR